MGWAPIAARLVCVHAACIRTNSVRCQEGRVACPSLPSHQPPPPSPLTTAGKTCSFRERFCSSAVTPAPTCSSVSSIAPTTPSQCCGSGADSSPLSRCVWRVWGKHGGGTTGAVTWRQLATAAVVRHSNGNLQPGARCRTFLCWRCCTETRLHAQAPSASELSYLLHQQEGVGRQQCHVFEQGGHLRSGSLGRGARGEGVGDGGGTAMAPAWCGLSEQQRGNHGRNIQPLTKRLIKKSQFEPCEPQNPCSYPPHCRNQRPHRQRQPKRSVCTSPHTCTPGCLEPSCAV